METQALRIIVEISKPKNVSYPLISSSVHVILFDIILTAWTDLPNKATVFVVHLASVFGDGFCSSRNNGATTRNTKSAYQEFNL